MQSLAIREKLHSYIDTLPDQSLPALEPLLSFMTEEYWKPVIETDLTKEELEIIEEGERRYKEHPESFVSLETVKTRLRAMGKLKG